MAKRQMVKTRRVGKNGRLKLRRRGHDDDMQPVVTCSVFGVGRQRGEKVTVEFSLVPPTAHSEEKGYGVIVRIRDVGGNEHPAFLPSWVFREMAGSIEGALHGGRRCG